MNRIFYDKEWGKNEELKLFMEVWEHAEVKWIDQLDCSISWGRQRIDMTFSDFLKRLKQCKGKDGLIQWVFMEEEDMYVEPLEENSRVFSAFVRFDDMYEKEKGKLTWRDLFGWAYMKPERAKKLIEEYGLIPHKC